MATRRTSVTVRIQGKPFNIIIVQVYAPTTGAEEAEVDQFYEGLQHLQELTPKNDVLIIMGDWNAKVGSQKITGITGKFGLGVQNEAGHSLVEFCQENTMVIANTLFQQPKRRLYTWTSPDGQHRNQIDYVLCSQRWRSSIQSVKTRPGADCGSDHELLVAKCRLKLKKVGKSTRPLRYDLNHIPDEYTVEVTNRFKELDLIDRVPEELWMEVCNIVQEAATKTIPKKKKCKKAKWLSEEVLQMAEERREAKGKGERERYKQLNAEFQRIVRRDKNAFLNEQCKEIEENNRMRTRDLFKKIGDMKGKFHAKMGMIKDQNGRDLTEAEEIKEMWHDYTEELYKKELNVPDNHNGVVTDLEPDILECEVKWALGSLSNNKTSGGDKHIMRKAGLDESPVGIKIAGRNINHLRYADDTTLMAESEEELKSLLMRVKEESAKVGLKLNMKKTKIMASGPLTSWQIDGEEMEVVTDFIFLGSKITAGGVCSQEIKRRFLLGRKAMANLDSILKSRDITLPTKVHIVKAMVFPVAMYGCESWTIRKAEHQRIETFELWCWRDYRESLGPQGDQIEEKHADSDPIH
ncbi:Craniofacial development protein 2 [Varanus komodoensis]|nr:Craniofacial development protein 2 [Varanus komodoensis]